MEKGVWLRRGLMVVLAFWLCSCGGGGGGGGGGEAGFSVSFNTRQLSFDYLEGGTPDPQLVVATAHGTPSGNVFIGAYVEGEGIQQPIYVDIDPAAGKAFATVVPMDGLPAGEFTGKVILLACADENCNRHYPGSPHKVDYRITVRQRLKASPASLTLAAAETQASAAQVVTLTLPEGASAATTSVQYGVGGSGWLQVQNNGASLSVAANAAALAPGSYTAVLQVDVASAGQSVSVPVALTVSSGLVAPGTQSLTVDLDAAGTGSFAVTAAPGVAATHWSASSNQSWLVLDTTTGAMGDSLQWHIDPALFAAYPNNASQTATITLGATGLAAAHTTVTVLKQLKEISHIDTLAVLAGGDGDVLLYGKGFASIANFASRLYVGGLTPASVTVLSDTLARVSLTAVPAGDYSVYLQSAMGMATRSSTLRVLERQTYSYSAIDTAGGKGAVTWDPVSRSAYAVDLSVSRVHRFGWNGSAFVNTVTPMSQPYKLGMDRDRASVVVVSSAGLVKRLDPVTLAELSSTAATYYFGSDNLYLPLTIDGSNRLWVGTFSHDLDAGTSQSFTIGGDGRGIAYVSRDGRRLLFSHNGSYSPAPPAARRDLLDGAFSTLPNDGLSGYFYVAAANRDGSRWVLHNYAMYDYGMLKLGSFTVPSGWVATRSELSRDGNRTYMLAFKDGAINVNGSAESTTTDKLRIFVFDTSPLSPAQTQFPLLGYFDVQDYASCRTFYGGCYPLTMMAIAEDDRTLFLAGDRKFIAQPIPEAYMAAGAAPAAPAPTAAGSVPAARPQPRLPATLRQWRLAPPGLPAPAQSQR